MQDFVVLPCVDGAERDVVLATKAAPEALGAEPARTAAMDAAARGCVKADVTIMMLAPKSGLLGAAARPYVGTLVLAPLIERTFPL